YLIGSIPFGVFAGQIVGIDIRQHGSGNIGATNVLRTLGKKYGIAVFLADALKGLIAVRLAVWFAGADPFYRSSLGILAAIFVVGFSVFIALLVIWRHWENIVRLASGTEPRFDRK